MRPSPASLPQLNFLNIITGFLFIYLSIYLFGNFWEDKDLFFGYFMQISDNWEVIVPSCCLSEKTCYIFIENLIFNEHRKHWCE